VTLPVKAGQVLRIDEIWLAREPLDMRCGPETTLARVIKAFGAAKPHCAYVFANKRANRMKILLCDGFGSGCWRGGCTRAASSGAPCATVIRWPSMTCNCRHWRRDCPGSMPVRTL
jgi:hypothetical protein